MPQKWFAPLWKALFKANAITVSIEANSKAKGSFGSETFMANGKIQAKFDLEQRKLVNSGKKTLI